MSDREIIEKLQQLRNYIPFVEQMIKKLEVKSGPQKTDYLEKLRGLHTFLTSNPDARRINSFDMLLKMEKIIKGMYHSAGKSGSTNDESAQRRLGIKSYNRETSTSFGGSSSYGEKSKQTSHNYHEERSYQYDTSFSGRRCDPSDYHITGSRQNQFAASFRGSGNMEDVDYRIRDQSELFRYPNVSKPFERGGHNYYKDRVSETDFREYEHKKFQQEKYSKDFDERKLYSSRGYKTLEPSQRKLYDTSFEAVRNQPSSSKSNVTQSDNDYIRKERELFGEDIFGDIRNKRLSKPEQPKPKKTLLDLPMPPVKPFNPKEYISYKQNQNSLHKKITEIFPKSSNTFENKSKDSDDRLIDRINKFQADECNKLINTKINDVSKKNITETHLSSKSEGIHESLNKHEQDVKSRLHGIYVPPDLMTDTPQSPELEAKFSPTQNDDEDEVKAIPLEKSPASKGTDILKDSGLMEEMKKVMNFISENPVEKVSSASFRYEDFVGPAGRREAHNTLRTVGDINEVNNIFGSEDLDLRRADVDLRQLPKPIHPTVAGDIKSGRVSKFSNYPLSKDIDMRSFNNPKPQSAVISSLTSIEPKKDILTSSVNMGSVRARIAHDSEKLIKLGKKGVAATQMDFYKQKRDKINVGKSVECQIKAHKTISLLDELLPINKEEERKNKALPLIKSIPSKNILGVKLKQSNKSISSDCSDNSTVMPTNASKMKNVSIIQEPLVSENLKETHKTEFSTDNNRKATKSPVIMDGSDILASVADLPSKMSKKINKDDVTIKSKDPRTQKQTAVTRIDPLGRDPRVQNKEPAEHPNMFININRGQWNQNKEISKKPPLIENFGRDKIKKKFHGTDHIGVSSQHGYSQPVIRPLLHQSEMRFPQSPNAPMIRHPLMIPQPRPAEIPRLVRPPISFPPISKNPVIAQSFTCVILKGLPPYVNSRNIYRFFEHYLLRDLCIVLDNSLNCKGEAYVHFGSHKDAEDALNTLNGAFIDNYRIFIGICSVGILKQAKNTYGMQNIEREQILKIPQKPIAINWNPFYRSKPPKPIEVRKEIDKIQINNASIEVTNVQQETDKTQIQSSPIDRPDFNSPEMNSKGYSNMCGVKLSSKPKDMKKFKIPKVRKSDLAVEETPESKLKVKDIEIVPDNLSSSDELTDIIPASKSNRRYRKIKHVIESDSDSEKDSSTLDTNHSTHEKSDNLPTSIPNKKKKNKINVLKKTVLQEQKKKSPEIAKKIVKKNKKTQQSPPSSLRRGRSQIEKVIEKNIEEQKITRQTIHIEPVDDQEVSVVVPIPEKIVVSLLENEKSCKFIQTKKKRDQMPSEVYKKELNSLSESKAKDTHILHANKVEGSLIIPSKGKSSTEIETNPEGSFGINNIAETTDVSSLCCVTITKAKTERSLDGDILIEADSSVGNHTIVKAKSESSICGHITAKAESSLEGDMLVEAISESSIDGHTLDETQSESCIGDDILAEAKSENSIDGHTLDEAHSESSLGGDTFAETKSQILLVGVSIPEASDCDKSLASTANLESKADCSNDINTYAALESNIDINNVIVESKSESSIDSSAITETKSENSFGNSTLGETNCKSSFSIVNEATSKVENYLSSNKCNSSFDSFDPDSSFCRNTTAHSKSDDNYQGIESLPETRIVKPKADSFISKDDTSKIKDSISNNTEFNTENSIRKDIESNFEVSISVVTESNTERSISKVAESYTEVPISQVTDDFNSKNTKIINTTIEGNESRIKKCKENVDLPKSFKNELYSYSAVTCSDIKVASSKELLPNSEHEMESSEINKFVSISSEKSVFDEDDDFDLPDLTQITPSISKDFGIYDSDITDLSGLNKAPFITDEKNKSNSQGPPINKTDLDNINEISDQLVKSANEFTLNQGIELPDSTLVDSDEENTFSETVNALVDSLSESVKHKDQDRNSMLSNIKNSVLVRDVNDSESNISENKILEEEQNIKQSGVKQPPSSPSTGITNTDDDKDDTIFTESEVRESSQCISDSFPEDLKAVAVKETPIAVRGSPTSTESDGKTENEPVIETALDEAEKSKTKIVRRGADMKLSHSMFVPHDTKRTTRNSKGQVDKMEILSYPKVSLRSPTLLLRDIGHEIGRKGETAMEINNEEIIVDKHVQDNKADDKSTTSGEILTAHPFPQIPTSTSKKLKRGKILQVIQKKRITRGSMVVPEIKENILWDDGGVVDLFLCDQCDYVGKQQVFHLINFHSEREVPCIFRKEDFGPVLRDAIGPPELNENSMFLDISWIPAQMTFDEEIECQESECDYYSNSRFDFIYHLLEHNSESINTFFHCRLCNYMINDLIMFYDHFTSHTGEYLHACIRCGQRFFSTEALKLHHSEQHINQTEEFSSSKPMLVDGWPYIHVCKVCQYAQISKEKVEEHIQKKHNGKVDIKKANMTRQIKVWEEKKKDIEVKMCGEDTNNSPLSKAIDIKVNDSVKPSEIAIERDTINQDPVLTKSKIESPKIHLKLEQSQMKSLAEIASTCNKSVFLGNIKEEESDRLPSTIASNLTFKRTSEKPKLNESLLDNIIKIIKEDKNHLNEIDISKNKIPDKKENLSPINSKAMISSPTPAVFSPAKSPIASEVPIKSALKRPFSSLQESDLIPITSRDAPNREVFDYDSDRLVIDEERDVEGTPKKLLSVEEYREHSYQSPDEPKAKVRKSSNMESSDCNVSISSSVNDSNQEVFLRIESCTTVDPKDALNIFSDSDCEKSIVQYPSQEIPLGKLKTTQDEPAVPSSSTDLNSGAESVAIIPGSEDLPESGPTVPLFHLFCKYQLSKIFFSYISNQSDMVFKCMTLGCSFTSDCAISFEKHLHNHAIPQLRCCYCLCCESSQQGLIQHILLEHSHCELQCQYCLYRSYSRVYIGVHLKKFHPESQISFKKVNTIRSVPPPCPSFDTYVYPYRCSFAECSFKTIETVCFSNHVKCHGSMAQMVCYICQLVTPSLDLIKHMKKHMMNEYQCPYCLFGVEEREHLLTHLLIRHPGRPGRVLFRKQENIPALLEPTERNSPSRKVSIDSDSSGLLGQPSSQSIPSSLVASPSKNSSDNFSLDGTGLTGHTLYRCGNEKCIQSCPTQALLKEHLHICDFSRDSPLLKCFHCFKTFRHMSGLLEHIKVHGLKRYCCGAPNCEYRGPLPHYFKNHMKQIHHSSTYKIISKDFTNRDPETQEFIVYPKDVSMNIKEPHKKKKNEYAIEDIDKIPQSHICYNDLKCYHCPFISKVRLNLIKHLKLHQRMPLANISSLGETIPVKQPVNPVPRLDRKELMFDKMVNLAGSSFEDNKSKESNELRNKNPIPQDELPNIPIYIADEKINKCAIDGCKYVSCSEDMLKCHINTLHKQAESWFCPHCPNFRLNQDQISSHFKLHGPTLYRCGWCSYLSNKNSLIDRHMEEKHSNKKTFMFPIRTMEPSDVKDEDVNESKLITPTEPVMLWQCGLCIFRSVTNQEMVNHTTVKHDMKSQYKCGYCNVRSSAKVTFDSHFASKHPNKDFRVLCIFYRLDSVDIVPVDPSSRSVGHEPLWKRNDPDRPKQIRGIFIDDKSDKELAVLDIEPGEPSRNEFICPKCHSFKTPCINTFRLHLGKEANYQRFECAECGITSPLLLTIRRHYTRNHGEFTADCYLNLPVESHFEAWVESIISYQEQKIKLWTERDIEVKSGIKVTNTASSVSRRSSFDLPVVEAGTSGKVLHNSGLKFVCEICRLECRSASGLNSHTTAMHGTKFKCQYCPFNSNSELAVYQHCSSKHPTWLTEEDIKQDVKKNSPQSAKLPSKSKVKKSYQCPICSTVLFNYKLFVRHKKNHSVRMFVCQYCKKRFKSKSDGMCHSTKLHSDKTAKIIYEGEDPDTVEIVKQDPVVPANTAEEIPADSEYSCCHCGEIGSMQTIQEHMKVIHRELPYLVRKKTSSGLYLEVYRFTCGHCSLENVTLLEAMNHWLKIHVALDFAFKITIFSSSLISVTQAIPSQVKEISKKGVKRKLIAEDTDCHQETRKRKSRNPRDNKEGPPSIEDSRSNQVSSSTNDTAVDMVIKCGYCPLTFNTNGATVKHIKNVHGDNKAIKMHILEKGEYEKSHKGLFECNHCGKSGAIDEIHSHTLVAHPQLIASFKKITKTTATDLNQRFICTLCRHTVKTKRVMHLHIMKKHPHVGTSTDDYFITEFDDPTNSLLQEAGTARQAAGRRCGYCDDIMGSMKEMEEHNAFLHSHLPVKCSTVATEHIKIQGKKNTARKSFATGIKRSIATKSTSNRLQILHQNDPLSLADSEPEVYMDIDES